MCFEQEHGLDFQRLLDASTYKEAYRRDMIRWGEEKRQADPGFFCRKIVEGVCQPVWVSGLYGGIEKSVSPALRPSPDMSISLSPRPPPWPKAPLSLTQTVGVAPTLVPASALVPCDPFITQQPEWPFKNTNQVMFGTLCPTILMDELKSLT